MGTRRIKAVLDTNIYVAAYLSKNPSSPTAELLRRWRDGEFEVLYCSELLYEIVGKFRDRGIPPRYIIALISDLLSFGQVVSLPSSEIKRVILDDPDDDIVVACAKVGGATHIVTYDQHFRVLGENYEGIGMLDGLHFLYLLRGDEKA